MDDRYSFSVEWYDQHSSLIRKYQLLYYTLDGTCEMIDVKNRRLFLKRSKCPNIELSDLFIGSTINVLSRQLTVTGYGDEFTRAKLQSKLERTLGILKPDCVCKMGCVFEKLLAQGLSFCNVRMVTLTQKEASSFYSQYQADPFFKDMVTVLTEGPIVVFELVGECAISRWNDLLGPSDPALARKDLPDTLRAQYGTDAARNAFYGSDSAESAQRDINFFFGSNSVGQNTATYSNSTLGIIKPHAVKEGLTGQIINSILASGLQISALGMFNVEKVNAEEFYEVYKGVVREYTQMVDQLSSGPCIAMEIIDIHTHQGAHQKFRELVGPSDPEIARHLRPNTLRAKYGKEKITNAIHCTDLPEDQTLEVEYFFKILDY